MYKAGPANAKAHSDSYLSMYGARGGSGARGESRAKGRRKAQSEIHPCELTQEIKTAVLQANLLAEARPLASYSRIAPRSLAQLEEQVRLLEEDPYNAIARFATKADLSEAENLVDKRKRSIRKEKTKKKKKTEKQKRLDAMFGSSEEDEEDL